MEEENITQEDLNDATVAYDSEEKSVVVNELDEVKAIVESLKKLNLENMEKKDQIIKKLEEEGQMLRQEILMLQQANTENLEKKDKVIINLDGEREYMKDSVVKLQSELKVKNNAAKELGAELHAKEMIIKEHEEKEKGSKKETVALQKEIKIMKESMSNFKTKCEQLEAEVIEAKTTIGSLNDYINTLKEVNKDALKRLTETKDEGDNKVKINEWSSIAEVEKEEEHNMVKLYIGNLSNDTDKSKLEEVLGLESTLSLIELKQKRRKLRKQTCKFEATNECRYGRKCKFVHIKELEETVTYGEVTIPAELKNDVLQCDGLLVDNHKIIVEEIKNVRLNGSTQGNQGNQGNVRNAQRQCKYYRNGNCKKKEQCKFLHIDNPATTKNQNFHEGVMEQRIEKLEEMVRNFFSTLQQTPPYRAPIPQGPPPRPPMTQNFGMGRPPQGIGPIYHQ